MRRPAAGTVLGGLALAVALTPPATAAISQLAAGSVGTTQLQDGAVTGPKLHASAVSGAKVQDGSLGLADLTSYAGHQLPRAFQAVDYQWHDLTPGDVTYLHLTLPAGKWALTGKGLITAQTDLAAYYQQCRLLRGDAEVDFADSVNDSSNEVIRVSFMLEALVTQSAPTTYSVACRGYGQAGFTRLVAVEVR